jgi:hypothetical protein
MGHGQLGTMGGPFLGRWTKGNQAGSSRGGALEQRWLYTTSRYGGARPWYKGRILARRRRDALNPVVHQPH